MATDLENNTAHRTEISCLNLGHSRDRPLEVVIVLTVLKYFRFSLHQKQITLGGLDARFAA